MRIETIIWNVACLLLSCQKRTLCVDLKLNFLAQLFLAPSSEFAFVANMSKEL